MAKMTLYKKLQVASSASPEVIKAAYDAKLAALSASAAPEVAAERVLIREAYELLADPVRRKLYDDKLRDEHFRALSSGGEDIGQAKPANIFAPRAAEIAQISPLGWMGGVALLVGVGVIGTWVWLDYKHKAETHRLEVARQAEDARLREEQIQIQREAMDRARERDAANRQAAEERREEQQRLRERQQLNNDFQRQAQQEQARQRQLDMERRQADSRRQRQEQEDLRRSQQQLERDRRMLQELERNRGMRMP